MLNEVEGDFLGIARLLSDRSHCKKPCYRSLALRKHFQQGVYVSCGLEIELFFKLLIEILKLEAIVII